MEYFQANFKHQKRSSKLYYFHVVRIAHFVFLDIFASINPKKHFCSCLIKNPIKIEWKITSKPVIQYVIYNLNLKYFASYNYRPFQIKIGNLRVHIAYICARQRDCVLHFTVDVCSPICHNLGDRFQDVAN